MQAKRKAFTLIELLVVITLTLILAAIAVKFVPRVADNAVIHRGADRLVSWLAIAREQAKAINLPSGIRFYPDANGQATQAVYVQQPLPWLCPYAVDMANNAVTFSQPAPAVADFTNGLAANPAIPPSEWPVQPGDYLIFDGAGPGPFGITAVTPSQLTLVNHIESHASISCCACPLRRRH